MPSFNPSRIAGLIGTWMALWCLLPPGLHGQSVLVPEGSVWLYSDVGPLTGTSWRGLAFDDTGWAFGPAPLGYGDDDEATVVGSGPDESSRHIATYFRHHFNVDDPAAFPEMKLDVLRDDGAVVYLNGTEVFRTNMTSGSISATTAANSANGADESTQFYSQIISGALLEPGDNVLAVEIHQDFADSSDLSFDLRLSLAPPAIVPKGSVWRRLDNGTDPGAAWRDAVFDDTSWLEGRAQLGYGDGDEETVIAFVDTDPVTAGDQKNITTYFRRKFNVADTASIEGLRLEILRDDGVVAWLNGTEVARSNMPEGEILFTTPASSTATNAEGVSSFITSMPSASLLVAGENILAVEIHQESAASANISFDLRLSFQVPPFAQNSSAATTEDTPATVHLDASDDNGDALSAIVLTPPAHGTLSGTFPDLTFTPAANWSGADSFTWKANDGSADSNEVTVTLTVLPAPDAPVALPQTVLTPPDTPANFTLTGSDADGDALTFSIVTPPATGDLTGTPPLLTYTPAAGVTGSVTFTFRASDGTLDSDPATVTLIIDDPPGVPPRTMELNEDTSASIILTGTDANGHALVFSIVAPPAHGTLSGTLPEVTYTPEADFNGTDTFTCRASNGLAESMPATVSITVLPVNDPPVALPQAVSASPPLHFTLAGTDVDGDALTYSIIIPPPSGTLSGDAPALIFTPAPQFFGSVEFTFKVSDGTADSPPATVTLSIENAAPTVPPRTLETNEDTPAMITLTGTDANQHPLTFTVLTLPAHGNLSGTAPDLTYTPDANSHGADFFTYSASDGLAESEPATVSITVLPVNDRPVAQPLAVTSVPPLSFTLTGNDADGDPLTYSIVTPPSFGTLSGGIPALRFTPVPAFTGSVQFTFKVSDGTLDSLPAIVTLTVLRPLEVAIMAGQSNATSSITDYYVYYSGLSGTSVRRVDTYVGGAGIDTWVSESPEGEFSRAPLYLQRIYDPGPATAMGEAALLQTPLPSKVSFIWVQGETDSENDEKVAAYEARLRAFFTFVTEDFGASPGFTLVVGLIWYVDPENYFDIPRVRTIYQVREIQLRASADFHALVVDTSTMERRKDRDPSSNDAVHLSQPWGVAQFADQLRRSVLLRQSFRPESIRFQNGQLILGVVRGMRYALESSADLVSWSQSPSFLAPYPGTSPVQNLTWEGVLPERHSFFRLREVPPEEPEE